VVALEVLHDQIVRARQLGGHLVRELELRAH
jgi:hypothetical protein